MCAELPVVAEVIYLYKTILESSNIKTSRVYLPNNILAYVYMSKLFFF